MSKSNSCAGGLPVLKSLSCISASGETVEYAMDSGVRTRCSLCGDDSSGSFITFGGVEVGIGDVGEIGSPISSAGRIGG